MRAPVGPALARYHRFTRHRDRDVDSNTDGDVSRLDVLILSADPLSAALLGAAVELAGHSPNFERPGEGPRAALRRVRPQLALIDCDHDEACTDSFIGPAIMTGARVQLLCSHRGERDCTALARRLGLPIAMLPMEHGDFASLLHELSGTPTR
jgi:hypothetical protein